MASPRAAAAAAALLGAALAQLPDTTAGCGRYGCDPANSFVTRLLPPAGAGALSPQYAWRAPFGLRDGANASALASAGCVSTGGGQATCAAPAPYGLLTVGPNGSTVWGYAGAGASGGCAPPPPPFRAANLPVTDGAGDVVTWDGGDVALLNAADGSVGWDRTVYPSAACGEAVAAPSVTGHGDLSFTIAPTGEVFAYLADGIPQSFILLRGRDVGTAVFPPPEEPGPAPSPTPSPRGVFVPISQQGMDGSRALLVARFYAFGPGGPPPAAPLAPTPSLYLLGVDQRNDAVDRLYFQWQLALPTAGTPVERCVPAVGPGGAPPPVDPVEVVGPVGVPGSPGGVTLALACSAPPGGGGGGAASAVTVGAVVSGGAAPAVAWVGSLPFNATAGVGGVWAWGVDPAPPNATGGAPPAVVVAPPGAPGAVVGLHPASGAPAWGPLALPPALAALGHEQCELGLAMQQPGAAFLPTGPLLAATDGAATLLTLPGEAWVGGQPYQPRYWVAAFAVPPAAGGGGGGGGGGGRGPLAAMWCAPTPPLNATPAGGAPPGAYGAAPVTGQMALLARGGGGGGGAGVLLVPVADAVWGLQDAAAAGA